MYRIAIFLVLVISTAVRLFHVSRDGFTSLQSTIQKISRRHGVVLAGYGLAAQLSFAFLAWLINPTTFNTAAARILLCTAVASMTLLLFALPALARMIDGYYVLQRRLNQLM